MYWSLYCNWSQSNFSITHSNMVALNILLFTSIFCCRGPYFNETENQHFWAITVALVKQISHLHGHLFEISQTSSKLNVAKSNELFKQCCLSVKTKVFQNLSIFLISLRCIWCGKWDIYAKPKNNLSLNYKVIHPNEHCY